MHLMYTFKTNKSVAQDLEQEQQRLALGNSGLCDFIFKMKSL